MKIIQLTAENLKRLVAVEIRPDGNMVQISGKNGAGKTSVLDSIWWALCGARTIQSAPIRKGANQAKIRLDMGEIIVTRTFKREKEGEGFTTKLEVVGNVKGSPQTMLDSLLDSLAFDPLKFARMDPEEQFEALKRFAPDVDFDKIAGAQSIDMSSRKEINRKAKEARVLADQIEIPASAPTERIDETALVQQLADAGKHNSDIQVRAENRKNAGATIDRNRQRAADMRQQAAEIIRNAEALEAESRELEEKLAAAPPLATSIDIAELQARIAAARKSNELFARRQTKAQYERDADKFEKESKALTDQMARREQEKLDAIAKAKLPIESLTFGEGVVLLNGVPFDQASDAEQLKASCALAMAGNPQLRVIRVRDGSLLDTDSLELLARMAEERDYQVWVETVGAGKTGFILEDGHLLQRETEEQQAELPEVTR